MSVSGSGLSYTVAIGGITGDGTLGISIAAGTAHDLAGNMASAAGPSASFTVDNTPPTISVSSPSASYTTGGPIDYTVTYADANFASSSLVASDITLDQTGTANGQVSVSGSGLSYTVAIGGIAGDGTLGISIAAGTATDLASNKAPASGPSASFTVNNTPPTISISPPSESYTAGGPIDYTVTYADANFASSNLVASDITLDETGTANGQVSVSGSGLSYTVAIGGITGDGTLGISIAAGTATDLAGNKAPASGTSASFTVNNTPPTISISPPSESYTTGGPIDYTVTYADANFASSNLVASDITLDQTGTANGQVSVSGSGLSYTVAIGGITGDGTLGISITARTATDLAGNKAPASGPSATVTVDTTGPTLAAAASATPDPVTGTSAALAVLGADIATGEPSLTYTWVATTYPNGAAPSLSLDNGSNAAQNITALFSRAGDYTFQVTIADPFGLLTTSSVDVTVSQTLESIVVSPSSATLVTGAAEQFTGTADDQFGNALSVQPALTWSVAGSGGIDGNGLYTSPYASGSATVSVGLAGGGGLTATAGVTFSGQAPQWTSTNGSSWAAAGNWEDEGTGTILPAAPGVRGVVGDTASFNAGGLAGGTVTLDGRQSESCKHLLGFWQQRLHACRGRTRRHVALGERHGEREHRSRGQSDDQYTGRLGQQRRGGPDRRQSIDDFRPDQRHGHFVDPKRRWDLDSQRREQLRRHHGIRWRARGCQLVGAWRRVEPDGWRRRVAPFRFALGGESRGGRFSRARRNLNARYFCQHDDHNNDRARRGEPGFRKPADGKR